MRKLKLDLDDLQVTSFETQSTAELHEGTVFGHQPNVPAEDTQVQSCGQTYCGDYTCANTCACNGNPMGGGGPVLTYACTYDCPPE